MAGPYDLPPRFHGMLVAVMTSRSYIVGVPDAALVTDASGTVTLTQGVPTFEQVELEAAVLPSFVDDADAIHAPGGAPACSNNTVTT
jgi:hypothetical protein